MSSRDPFEDLIFQPQPLPGVGLSPLPSANFPGQGGGAQPPPTTPALPPPPPDLFADLEVQRDTLAEEAGIIDKIKSAGISAASGALATAEAPLYNFGIQQVSEDDYFAWSMLPADQRRAQATSKGIAFLQKVTDAIKPYSPTKELIDWFSRGALSELEQKSEDFVQRTLPEFMNRVRKLEEDNVLPGFWTQDLPHAVGITAGIGLASLSAGVASGGTVPPWAVAAYLGSSIGMQEGIEDAIQHGATPEQATIAAGVGGLLGTTEAIPITKILDRVDTATGGTISRALNRVVRQKLVGSILREGLKGAFEEGLQEAFQQIGMDTAAMLMYDKDREILSRTVDAVQAGGGTGFILSAVSTALGIRLRGEQQQEVRREFLQQEVERITGEPLSLDFQEAIRRDAPFTPLPQKYFLIKQAIVDSIRRIEEFGDAAARNIGFTLNELREMLGRPIGQNFESGHLMSGDFYTELDGYQINFDIEKGLPRRSAPQEEISLKSQEWNFDQDDRVWHLSLEEDGETYGGVREIGPGIWAVEVLDPKTPEGFRRLGTFETELRAKHELEVAAGIAERIGDTRHILTNSWKENNSAGVYDAQWTLQLGEDLAAELFLAPAGQGYEAMVLGSDGNPQSIGIFPNSTEAKIAAERHLGVGKETEISRGLTVREALEKQPVVVAGFDSFPARVREVEEELQFVERQIQDSSEVGIPAADLRSLEERREKLQEELSREKEMAQMERRIGREMKNLLASLREKYLSPETKIVLSGEQFLKGTEALGAMWSADNGRLVHIGVDIPKIMSYPFKDVEVTVRETILHEFGHALVNQRFEELTAKVRATLISEQVIRQRMMDPGIPPFEVAHLNRMLELKQQAAQQGREPATKEEIITYRGVMEEYKRWLSDQLSSPFIQRFMTISPPSYYEFMLQAKDADRVLSPNDKIWDRGYFFNFDEFMAENFARAGTQYKFVTDSSRKFFEEHRKMLEDVYSEVKDLPTMPAFTEWVKLMSNEGKLADLIGRLAKQEYTLYDIYRNPKRVKELGLDPNTIKGFREQQDLWHRWYHYGLHILQVARRNPHIEPLQRYVRLAQQFNNRINAFRWRGHNTLQQWRGVGRKQATLIGETLFEETLLGKPFTPEQLAEKGLNEDSLKVMNQVKADFAEVLNRMEQVLLSEVRLNFAHDPVEMNAELNRVKEEIARMRSKPFFPLMRFGRYTIEVRDKVSGKVVAFETFERRRHRNKAIGQYKKEFASAKYKIGEGYLTDSQMAVQGMPLPLLRELRNKLRKSGDLTPEMESAIDEMLKENLPLESFRRHFTKRKKIRGFSQDAIRSYASYMVQAATHLARIEMQSDLNTAVNNTMKDSQEISRQGKDGTKRGQIAQFMREHLDYMLNPTNDWPMLRSVGFVWFLGFNIKGAIVNSTQIFLATHPYLAARFGDVGATRALGKSMKDLGNYWRKGPNALSKEQLEVLARGKADGWLDESLATELAVARSSTGLDNSLPVTGGHRLWTKFAEIAALPFHTVEKMNRAITALAMHDLARKAGMQQQQAIALAREAVTATQFEYARWARPKFMQGKVGSNVFLFKSYLQNMMDLALGHDPAANRVLFAMLVMGGMLGLPFGEDLLDFIDVAGTKLKRWLGWDNPKVQSRTFIRELLLDMQMNPDLFMYGLSRRSFGLGHLGDLTGMPLPEFDLQGSLGMGNIIPGTEALRRLQEGASSGEAFLSFLGELGGAEASYMSGVAQALLEDTPDKWKKWEQGLPAVLRQMSRTGRYLQRGGEFTERGQTIAEFDPFDAQDTMELIGQAIGFTPTKVSEGWESYIAQREVVAYYETWRRALLRNHNYARLYQDSDSIGATLDAIQDYNEQVPYPEMRISGETLQRSLQEFARQRQRAGLSIPNQRQYIRLEQEIQDLYQQGLVP